MANIPYDHRNASKKEELSAYPLALPERTTFQMTGTPYDDVFRTIENDCARMLLPLLNETFGEHYKGDEKITFAVNEHFLNRQDGGEEKRITDSSFTVYGASETKKYHLECQSTSDNSMLIRIFEYDAQIALDGGVLQEDSLHVCFPHSAVLFLRSADTAPDEMRIIIHTPGGEVDYTVPAIKMKRYGLREIFEKRLWFLIPFYIFNHEKKFREYEDDPERMKVLLADYRQIAERLEGLSIQGEMDARECAMLLDMSKKVLAHIAKNYQKVEKEVREIMGGRVLEYESKTLWRNGIAKGRAVGMAEGKAEAILELLEELGEIPEELQKRIEIETDLTLLKNWHKLSARVESIEEFRQKTGI